MTSPTGKSTSVLSSRATEKVKTINSGAALATIPAVLASPAVSESVFDYLQPAETIQAAVREVAIGEPIDLSIQLNKNEYIIGVNWQVPGAAVKNYLYNRYLAVVSPITKQDLQQEKIRFYWLNDGVNKKTVRARVTVERLVGEDPSKLLPKVREVEYEFIYPFEVKAPVLDWFKAKTLKKPEIYGVGKDHVFSYSDNKSKKSGIRWDWKVTLPEGHGGLIKDVQIIFAGRQITLNPIGSDETETRQYLHPDVHAGKRKPHWQLDMSPGDDLRGSDADPSEFSTEVTYSGPGQFGDPRYFPNFPKRVAGGASIRDDETSDIPESKISSLVSHLNYDEHFKYFIMYKPDKAGAIWVSVAKAEWYWKGEADRQDSRLILKQGSGGLSSPGAVTTEFPIYDTNVDFNEFDKVK